jgi:hypothetical protein
MIDPPGVTLVGGNMHRGMKKLVDAIRGGLGSGSNVLRAFGGTMNSSPQ